MDPGGNFYTGRLSFKRICPKIRDKEMENSIKAF